MKDLKHWPNHRTYKLHKIPYPVDIYVSFQNTNSFAVEHGYENSKYSDIRKPVTLQKDLVGYCEQIFVDNDFAIHIVIGLNDKYFLELNDHVRDEHVKTITHEIIHCVGCIYSRVGVTFDGNEHDAYLVTYLINTILKIMDYDISLENK